MLRTAIALAAALATIPAYAKIFKCTDSSGGIEYRDGPCPEQTSGAVIDVAGQTNPGSNPKSDAPIQARPAPKQKRPDVVAMYSFRGPRSIPPPQPVAALPPPPPK